MTDLFTISAEYGQWEDHCEVQMFNTLDESEARAMLTKLAAEIAGVYAEVRDRMAYNGDRSFDNLLGSEAVVEVARRGHWDDGVSLYLRKQPFGVVHSDGRQVITSEFVDFIPNHRDEDEYMANAVADDMSMAERLALPFEIAFEGWRAYA